MTLEKSLWAQPSFIKDPSSQDPTFVLFLGSIGGGGNVRFLNFLSVALVLIIWLKWNLKL